MCHVVSSFHFLLLRLILWGLTELHSQLYPFRSTTATSRRLPLNSKTKHFDYPVELIVNRIGRLDI